MAIFQALFTICVILFPFLTVRQNLGQKPVEETIMKNGLVRCIHIHVLKFLNSDTVCKILVDGGFHYVW